MELYHNNIEPVRHVVYYGDWVTDPALATVNYRIMSGDTEIDSGLARKVADGVYEADLGLQVTGDFDVKTITWSYTLELEDGTTRDITTAPELISIVRPYITVNAYNQEVRGEELLPSQFRPLEREVRNVIDSYCRQDFQLRPNITRTIPGSSSNTLQLPDRLVRLRSLVAVDEPIALLPGWEGIYDDDSLMERQRADKLDFHTLDSYVSFDPSNPWEIRRRTSAEAPQGNPVQRYEFFKSARRYAITGDWGWEYVPSIVQQAAGILVRDYMDDDSKYREKWIDNVRAADWRMEFAATGSETTGHANVDMMLERFRNYRPEVV